MAKITIQNEEGQNLNRYLITPTDGGTPFTADLARAANITKQGTPFSPETMAYYVQDEDIAGLSTAVQSATIGGAAVPKNETALQFPAYPVIPSSLPANGGTAADTTNITSALTLSTAAPTVTLAAGKLYGVY